MNREIELHDSTLREIELNQADVTLHFDRAYVHCSEGTPGINAGTGWSQKIDLVLSQVTVIEIPNDLPDDITDGFLVVNGKKLDNMIPLPFAAIGKIEVMLLTQYGKKLRITAEQVYAEEIDQPLFIEDCPGFRGT